MKKFILTERNWIPAFAGMTVGFLVIEFLLYQYVDRPIAEYFSALDQTHHGFVDFFRSITDLGKSKGYLIITGLAALFCVFLARGKDVKPGWRMIFSYVGARALFLFASIAASGIVTDIIKSLLGRARPNLWLKDGVFGFAPFTSQGFWWNSMPSGHTTTVFTFAAGMTVLYPRLRVLWFSYALVLAASRIIVDAHYLSDVCAGAAVGLLTVWALTKYCINPIYEIFPIDKASRVS